MSFVWPWMLVSLLLSPLAAFGYVRLRRRRQRAAAGLGPFGLLQDQAAREPARRRHAPPALYLAGLTLMLLGLARPELTVRLPRLEGTVILAFDVSESMAADDLEPSRIDAAKAAALSFVDAQPPAILLGVVAFSNGGLIVQAPTDDRAAVATAIQRLTPQGGTSLGQGIFAALNAIAGEPLALEDASAGEDGEAGAGVSLGYYPSSVILLLTDGENTGPPEPLEIAQLAAEAGVRIYPVGIGSPEGATLALDGFTVLTQLDEPALRELASLTNGAYFRAEDEASLHEVYENVDLRLTVRGEKMEVTSLLAGCSLVLLLGGVLLSLRWYGRAP